MENVLITIASQRGIAHETSVALQGMPCRKVLTHGISDTALARNVQLTRALKAANEGGEDVVLMVDDDMVFDLQQAHQVTSLCRRLKLPVSGLYVDREGHPCVSELTKANEKGDRRRFVTGLGFLAIPTKSLGLLADMSQRFEAAGNELIAFTWSGPMTHPHEEKLIWFSEDYMLTKRLRGAVLANETPGHLKSLALYPRRELIDHFFPTEDDDETGPLTQRQPEPPAESLEPDPVHE